MMTIFIIPVKQNSLTGDNEIMLLKLGNNGVKKK